MRSELAKYTKEEIINALEKYCKSPDKEYIKTCIIYYMDEERCIQQHNKFNKVQEECDKALNEYLEAYKKYNDYLFDIARKYNILKEDGSFKYGDWFDKATKEEMNNGLNLERDMKRKYDLYRKYDREIDIYLGIQKRY